MKEERCQREEMRRKENVKKGEKKDENVFPFFPFLPSFAVLLLCISERMYNSTTAVPKKYAASKG